MRKESPGVLKVNYGAANFPTSAHGPFINGDQVIIAGTGTALDSTPGRQYLVANSSGSTFTSTLAPAVPDRMSSLARTTLMPAISVAQCYFKAEGYRPGTPRKLLCISLINALVWRAQIVFAKAN
jgi:hypothetical protein